MCGNEKTKLSSVRGPKTQIDACQNDGEAAVRTATPEGLDHTLLLLLEMGLPQAVNRRSAERQSKKKRRELTPAEDEKRPVYYVA